ncbi:MAG: hypothetical protein CL610_14955 [Anaerolineaceae bacterium]|nr:hypothetical protein [Anaerolineaceae bacterium]
MIGMIRGWYETVQHQYNNPLDQRRAAGLSTANLVLLVAAAVALVAVIVLPLLAGEPLPVDVIISIIAVPFVVGAIQRLVLIGNVQLAARAFVALATLAALIPVIDGNHQNQVVMLAVALVAAGTLLRRRDIFLVIAVLAAGLIFGALQQRGLTEPITLVPADSTLQDLVMVLFALGISAVVLTIFSGTSEQVATGFQDNQQRLRWLTAARLGSAPDENTVMVRTGDLLMEELLYTFTQFHLLDERNQLFTYVRTGMGTRHTVTRATFSDESAIYEAIRQQQTIAVSVYDRLETHAHFLPSTQWALALPLIAEGKVIGVLDIQSSQKRSPFHDSERTLLELVAAETAAALTQTRTQAELRRVLETRDTAAERLQAQITDLRRQVEQSRGSDWMSYLQNRGQSAFGFDLGGRNLTLTAANDLPEHLRAAMLRGEMVIEKHQNDQVVNLPIKRYDEVLGGMSFALPADQVLTPRQIDMANEVTNRLAVALENARLVEQSQAQAARERKAGEVSNLLLGQQEVRTLLDTAAESFNEALGAIYTRIYLDPEILFDRGEEAL